jgi:hypothetical protein
MQIEKNEENLQQKITKTANLIKNRHLTHLGKACLINTIVLSKLWYVATVYTPSEFFFQCLEKFIFSLVWKNDKCPRCDLSQETTEHCLFTCPTNKLALSALYALIPTIEGNTTQNNLDLISPKGTNIPHQNAIVLGEYIYTTWIVRNQVIFKGLVPTPKTINFFFYTG